MIPFKRSKLSGMLLGVSSVLCVLAANALANDVFKLNNGNALDQGSSWQSGSAPTASDVAVWDGTIDTTGLTNNLGTTTNWAGVRVQNAGTSGSFVITNAATTLLIGASGVDTSSGSQTLTFSCPVALITNNANNVWNLTANVTVSGGLNGTNILQKTGSGTLFLATATMTPTVQVDSGIAQLNTGSGGTIALNGGTVNINVADGNPINVMAGGGTEQNLGGNRTWSGALSGSGPLTVAAASTHTWSGNNANYTGTLTLQGTGTLRLSSLAAVSAGTAYSFNNGNMSANAAGIFNLGSLGGSGTLFGGAGQNYSIGALNASTDFSGVISGSTVIFKIGTGTQTLSGANTYSGITVVSNGVLQVGNGGSSGSLASPAVFLTNGTSVLSFNRGDAALNFTNIITGVGSVQQNGNGTTFLSGPAGGAGVNNYSGGTVLTAGILKFTAGALGTGGIWFTNGNPTLQWASGNTADISSQTVTFGSSAILDVNGNTVTLANPIGNSGSGSLTVNSTLPNGVLNLQGANTHSGGTIVNSGTMRVNNGTGSATGSGSVTVNSGGTLGGAGTISGTVDVQGMLAPGNSVGTLTVGSLTLESSSTNNFEFNSTPANDKVVVTVTDGFTVNGGVFNLYAEGGITPWTTLGTYNLIQYSGTAPSLDSSWTTASATNPHVGNPQTGYLYAFSTSSGFLKVTISPGAGANIGVWNVNGNGNWSVAGNWSGISGSMPPRNAGDAAILGVGTALHTVTLNANETVGAVTFSNVNSFVVGNAGNTLTLDNSGSGASVTVSDGTANAIQTAVALNDNTTVTVSANKSLSISGTVANTSGAKSLIVGGTGTLALSGNNSYGPAASSGFGTTLNGATVQVGNNNSLGAGDVSIAVNSTLQAGAAGLSMANNIDITPGATATLDNNGNNITLSGAIADSGNLTKIGNGVLTLGGSSSYSGNTTVNAGVLSLSADANVGSTPNIILNGGDLFGNGTFSLSGAHNIGVGPLSGTAGTNALIDVASGQTFEIDGVIASAGNSGANNLVVNSGTGNNGTLVLANANTFNGTTVVSNGTLFIMNSFALQNSTLIYNSGFVGFSNIASAGFGGLMGTNSLALTNQAGAGVALTVGSNNVSTTYDGNLNDSALGGSFTKAGTGTLTLTGTNAYNGGTSIGNGGGTLQVAGGSLTTSNFLGTQGSGRFIQTSNAAVSVTGTAVGTVSGGGGGGVDVDSGTASFGNLTIGGSSNGGAVRVNGGTVSILTFKDVRDASSDNNATLTSGLVINGGSTTVSNLQLSTGNSGADLTVSNGSLTVGNPAGAANFIVGSGTSSSRGGFVTVRGGTLTYLGTDGLLLNNTNTSQGTAQFDGGVSTFAGITMNNPLYLTGGHSILRINGGTVYLGSVGLVENTNATGATGVITLTTGILGATADWSSAADITVSSNFTIQAADASAVAHNITLSGTLSGAGGITKTGNGTLTLSGANTYTNNTTVGGGTLVLQQPFLSTNSIVSVSNGATLNLSFSVTNNVHGLVLGGTNKPGGVYNNTTDPAYITGSGSLQVVQTVSLIPTNITASVSGNSLILSWPADHTGWRLQSQTNSLSVGLVSNWVDVAGSTATNQMTISINPANGSVFFRMVYP